ncbi:hypothetical protein I2I11_13880 [Pontibacter sp. 172403-2]|uniref:hypothetical protein n=1 Tax=Pontibacter rufus TaxID=2791028 RepID=UPI0018AFAD2E|nr:hypothetical protein [Pontibacter sp. 172403-2]MBF9254390.1 hypothetical protein [Pontibacter sp. 172403-2]
MKKLPILLIILSSCMAKESIRMETMDFGPFSIDLPAEWRVHEVQGIDSYVREIITGDGDTIYFDYGYYSNSLEEESVRMYPTSMIPWFLEREIDTTGMVFLDKETITESEREKYRKQIAVHDTIDGFTAKIVEPKVAGNGLTGVYFDSLGEGSLGKIMLQISGIDLTPINNHLFLKSIKTIRIKKE